MIVVVVALMRMGWRRGVVSPLQGWVKVWVGSVVVRWRGMVILTMAPVMVGWREWGVIVAPLMVGMVVLLLGRVLGVMTRFIRFPVHISSVTTFCK